MGRSRQPGRHRPAGPAGPAWTAFRRRLFSWEHWGPAPACYLCGHPIAAPGWQYGEVQHHVSPSVAPALAWQVANLAPVHGSDYRRSGGVNKRCPECDLACNAIAAGNAAPRDAAGRPVPFPPEFLAAKIRERERFTGRPGPAARESARVPGSAAGPGRPW